MEGEGMSKSPLGDVNVRKYYIITRPTRLSELQLDDFDEETDYGWREKARSLQVRRWRKIKNQLA